MFNAENLKIYVLTKGNHCEHTGGHSLKDQAAGVEVLKLEILDSNLTFSTWAQLAWHSLN